MKKLLAVLTAIVAGVSALFAQTVVTTDAEIRAAVQTNNANIQLGGDIDLSNKTLEIPKNNTVTLDLNGHKLDRKLSKRGQGGGQVITVRQGATLNLSNGTLTGGWGGAGGALVNEGGTVELTDVTCSNNVADDRGGGICNRDGGVLTMTGGAITNNSSNDKTAPEGGGGLFNETGATATLTNVTITGNKAKVKGGGGICNYGTMTLDGCTVTDNSCQMNGGGIWTAASATLNMQGALNVSGNQSAERATGFDNDLFLKTGAVLTVTGSLAGSDIHVDMESGAGIFTSGYNTHNSGVDPATVFSSQIPQVMAVTLENNEAKLGSSLAEGDVYYIDHRMVGTQLTPEIKILHQGEYKLITPAYYEDTDINMSGTYVVVTDDHGYKCHYDGIAYVTSDTKIILCDGAKLEMEGVVNVANNGTSLYVYGQMKNSGILQTNANISHVNPLLPGIGSGFGTTCYMYFHGGVIKAQGESESAGIAGGRSYQGQKSNITFYDAIVEARGGGSGPGIGQSAGMRENKVYVAIYGGEVKAYGGNDGAGIGGGWDSDGVSVRVEGGIVKAYGGGNGAGIGSGSDLAATHPGGKSGDLYVSGGEVYAYGGVDAAGIGGGEDCDGSTVTITGGYVYAEGKDNGAGIGGGEEGKGGNVTITGGTVVAKAGCDDVGCRAIGPGQDNDDYGSLTIGDEMMVSSERKAAVAERKNMCWYRTSVRVEPCTHPDGFTYTVDGTTPNDHHTSHCRYCSHSRTDLHHFEHGVCTVCGVEQSVMDVMIYLPSAFSDGSFDGETYERTATYQVVPNADFNLPSTTLNVPGLTFIGWEATTDLTGMYYKSPYTTATADTLYRAGNKYKVSGNISFVARYKVADIYLYDDEPNGEILNEYNGMKVSKVTLSGRVFNKNNTWQPLALPFSLSAEELATSPLAGCTLKELDTENSYNDAANHMVYLYFKDTTAIAAGVPYIIRWESGDPVLSPEFANVTLTNKTADAKGNLLMYKAIYSPQTFTSANKMVLYFQDNGVLVQPNGQELVTVGSCRAYFRLTNLMGGDPDAEWTISTNIDGLEGIENVQKDDVQCTKVIRNGLLFIERNGKIYNVQGALIED